MSGSLSDATAVSVESGASYELGSDDTVGSLSGAGLSVIEQLSARSGREITHRPHLVV